MEEGRARCCQDCTRWALDARKEEEREELLQQEKLPGVFVGWDFAMDVLPMCSIFQELQIVHDTGYFSALPSLEEYWQQVTPLSTELA